MAAVRSNVTVTVSEPVDGSSRRRGPDRRRRRAPSSSTVDPAVMSMARALLRPGERIRIESSTAVVLVNR